MSTPQLTKGSDVRLSPAELAAERQRDQRQFWVAFGFVIGMGILIFVVTLLATQAFRRRTHGLLARLDLGMRPADGIAVTAALLAVVVALNIALAAQQTPTDPKERVRATNWQAYVFLISALTASGTVTVSLICWLSADRGDSLGDCVSLGLIALITVALASALQLKAPSAEALVADEYVLESRLAGLTEVLSRFREQYPYLQAGRLAIVLRYAWLAALFGWTSVLVALGIAGLEQRFLGWSNLISMGLVGTALEVCLLAAASQLSMFRFLRRTLDRVWRGYLLIFLLGLPAMGTLLVLLPWSPWFRIPIIGYYLSIWTLAAGAFLVGGRYPRMRLTAGWQASTERVLVKAQRQVLGELSDVRARSAAARRNQVRNRLRPAIGPLPPRRRRTQPAGRRNRPA